MCTEGRLETELSLPSIERNCYARPRDHWQRRDQPDRQVQLENHSGLPLGYLAHTVN